MTSVRQMSLHLPKWPDAVRGGPNVLLRSALFAGIHSKKRQFLGIQTSPEKEPEGVIIAAQDGQTIKFAGTQLNQYDADVFFELLHRSRRHALGDEAVFMGSDFLASIGRSDNNLGYEDLNDSLRRLKRGTVDVVWTVGMKRYVFEGSLVSDHKREEQSRLYRVSLSPEIKTLFSPASWTQLEWNERMQLKGKPLAQWLHSYFSTHARPYPVSVEFIKEKCGSPTKLAKHFKPELRTALNAMESLIGWRAEWDGELVKVMRPATGSQARHIARKDSQRKALHAANKKLLSPSGITPAGATLGSLFG
jgi:TrfA protein